MYGEDLLIGQRTVKIDGKNRIYLPPFTKAEKEDEIALINKIDNTGFPYIKLYLLKKYKEIVRRLQKLQENATNVEEYMQYEQKIIDICSCIDAVLKVDSQRRVLIPQDIMATNKWQERNSLICEGKGNFLVVR